MLNVVSSYFTKTFIGELMSYTWENDEKPNFETNFDPFRPNLGSPIFIQFLLPVAVKHYFQPLCYAI